MKLVMISLITFLSASAFACTDFSGTFKDKDDSIITISQIACVSVVITQEQSSYKLYADGYLRLLQIQDIKNGDDVVGKNRLFGSATFKNENLKVNYKVFTTNIDNSTEQHDMDLDFSIDDRNNLIIVLDKHEGGLDSDYFTRQVK